ncbi:MAG TPA: 50S ribosomal protein L24 [Candidatus Acidoferrum sp.]|jgi:large subunit ribosomal protein L24|nr:50S ribosomal protein L24 [Candidatus Acidoferrum sp.]
MAIAKRKPAEPVRIEIKKEDTVKVIAGRDKGREGRVLAVNRETGRVLVEHVGMVKRHTRPNPQKQIKGGIAERESPVAVSNLMVVCPGCHKAVRIAHHVDVVAGGKTRRTRICRKCGQTLDKK